MTNLPSNYESFNEARKKGFIEIKKLKDQGKKVVGVYCAFTPQEIISAAGIIPVSLCGMSEEPIAAAEQFLPRNLCPLIKSSYGHAITDTCPYFYFADYVVGETTCDGKKKMYEEIAKMKPMHMMYLPNSQFGKDSFAQMKHEVLELKKTLESHFGVDITEEAIREQIKIYNRERVALRNFYELGKLIPPPVTGRDIQKVFDGSEFCFDSDGVIEMLNQLTVQAKADFENGNCPVKDTAPRVMITGCPIGGVTEKVLAAIEAAGAVVVAFENCGAIRTNHLVDETMDPIDALTEKYLSTGCACMSPNTNRLKLIEEIMNDYAIDGVVDVVLQACHTFNLETTHVSRLVKDKMGKAYMTLETDYSKSDAGQLKTRLEAFVELIS